MDIDLIGAIVFELDPQGRFRELNRAARSFFGETVAGASFFDTFVPPTDQHQARSAFKRALNGRLGASELVEMVVIDSGGETHLRLWRLGVRRPLSEGSVEGIIYAGMDLPDQLDRAHARSLKELSDIKHALDASTIVAITDVDGTITFVNDKFCEISQYSREELLGKNHRIINSGHHPKEFFKEMWATIGRGKIWQADIKNRAKDGTYYWVSTTIVPFLDEHGKPQQYVALRHEITERKRAEAALVQAEKLSSIGMLVAGIAHEVNNPLSGVLGCIKALHDKKTMSADRREEYFRTALEGLERIQQTMRGLLDFARQRQPRAETVEVADVVASALRLIAPALRKKELKIESSIEPLDLTAHADRGHVLQALVNVLLNAAYVSPDHGSIRIRGLTDEKGRVRIAIKDYGPGIPPEDVVRVCDPFFSTKPEGEGTGLGLAVTLGLLKANDGDLEIKSEVGSGAEMTLILPCAAVEREHARSLADR